MVPFFMSQNNPGSGVREMSKLGTKTRPNSEVVMNVPYDNLLLLNN